MGYQRAGNYPNYKNGFDVTLHEGSMEAPLKWMRPSMVSVASMGDLFHESVPADFIVRAWTNMRRAIWNDTAMIMCGTEPHRCLPLWMLPRGGLSENATAGIAIRNF